MALPSLAQVSDLAAWVGVSLEATDPRAGAVLSAASALVRSHTGQTWTDDSGNLDDVPDVVSAVVVQVAARVWNNPDGLTSVTLDDGTRRWAEGSAGLRLTDDEKALLADYSASGQPADLGTVSLTTGRIGLDTIYVPTGPPPSGPPFPWYAAEEFE